MGFFQQTELRNYSVQSFCDLSRCTLIFLTWDMWHVTFTALEEMQSMWPEWTVETCYPIIPSQQKYFSSLSYTSLSVLCYLLTEVQIQQWESPTRRCVSAFTVPLSHPGCYSNLPRMIRPDFNRPIKQGANGELAAAQPSGQPIRKQ